ncbi:hypothetical protein SAMN06272735_3644 [Streptomyces sp. TLI_55]|uniref:hypothetical protein n=1 Tax=Streptomyces sp. TLI_55 TaxID=1938861 RepID=UPI000BCC0417|nr:hypothetical protein [Streptomyces sp. TLI_55]SNX61894.1 hypothetical protein SAMN06272735_3644 [Streptomyces sp. TLI_55]
MADTGFVDGMTPYLRASLGAHGERVLDSEGVPVVSGPAEVGRRMLRATHRRGDERGREALAEAVADAVAEPGNEDALGALRQLIRRALSKDPGLEAELAALLPHRTASVVVASGERSIAAGGNIGVAITGDGHGSSTS